MYADDTSISHSSELVDAINSAINDDLSNLKLWLGGNKLYLNVMKFEPYLSVAGQNSKIFQTVMALALSLFLMTRLFQ